MKPFAFHREAAEEYTHAAHYYAQIDPKLAVRFYDEMERLIQDIRHQPDLFRLFDAPIRRHFSRVFPYALLFVDRPERVLILSVMHMQRRPGYWKRRLS